MATSRRLKEVSNVDLIPMIDIVFQLVVFFIFSTVFNTAPGVQIDYPDSSSSEVIEITTLIIWIDNSNTIYINDVKYSFSDFKKTIKAIDDEKMKDIGAVVINGDSSVPYGLVMDIMNVLRLKGFSTFNLQTEYVSGAN